MREPRAPESIRGAGSAGVNEKTAENPRSWPQKEAISPLKGDGSQDFRCFFRAGRRIVRARPFGTFGLTKVHDNVFSVLSLDRKYQRSRDEQRESPRSRQTAEIYARSCKAQCFTSLLRLDLAEQSFFGKDLSRIVLYKQRRFEGGAALQDFQLFADSPRAHAPRSSHGLPAQPGEGLEVFLF